MLCLWLIIRKVLRNRVIDIDLDIGGEDGVFIVIFGEM